jgi:hypothetical protein
MLLFFFFLNLFSYTIWLISFCVFAIETRTSYVLVGCQQFFFVLMIVALAVLGDPAVYSNPWMLRRPFYGAEFRRQEIPRASVSQGHLGFGGIIFG